MTKASDWIAVALFLGFGLWWLILPRSVLSFYTWFHRGKLSLPRPGGIRLAGVLWILILAVVETSKFTHNPPRNDPNIVHGKETPLSPPAKLSGGK